MGFADWKPSDGERVTNQTEQEWWAWYLNNRFSKRRCPACWGKGCEVYGDTWVITCVLCGGTGRLPGYYATSKNAPKPDDSAP